MTTLYRLFDGDGRLLYIGVTDELDRRMGVHSRLKPWWPQVSATRTESFESRSAAFVAEAAAIANEQPLHNVRVARPAVGLLGQTLRTLRQDRGLTVEKLAAKADTAAKTIYRIEAGEDCTMRILDRIATALDMDLLAFLRLLGIDLSPEKASA